MVVTSPDTIFRADELISYGRVFYDAYGPDPTLLGDYPENQIVSADSAESTLVATVTLGNDNLGNPINPSDGTVIQWRVEGPNTGTGNPLNPSVGPVDGYLANNQTTTIDGDTGNILHTSTHAGDVYKVYAKIVKLVINGQLRAYKGAEVLVATAQVVPGAAFVVSYRSSKPGIAADGQSKAQVTLTAKDMAGNLVAAGTPVGWSLEGGGFLSSGQATINDEGEAAITLHSGSVAGPVTVSANVSGKEVSTIVQVRPLQIQLEITGNVITLGTNEEATITAKVNDSTGMNVADGTPINWFVQKGGFKVKDSVVRNGIATLVIQGQGGSQIPGNGIITASVGNAIGSLTYLWVVPPSKAVRQHRPSSSCR